MSHQGWSVCSQMTVKWSIWRVGTLAVMSGAVRTARPGRRVNRVFSATSPCILARGAPRQKCVPAEKLRWGLGVRLISNRSGSGKVAGSRFAAARNSMRGCPAGQATPWMSAG
jgi:hypothetical protein